MKDRRVVTLRGIEEKDIICVEIAALCHDLGHALLSHFFDGDFIAKKLPITDPYSGKVITEWNHEMASVLLIDQILKKPEVKAVLNGVYQLDEVDEIFIKELIDPEPLKNLKERI